MGRLLNISLVLTGLVLFIAGCAVQPTAEGPAAEVDATRAMSRGDYAEAARDYLQLAEAPNQPEALRQHYRLQAAEALLLSGQAAKAQTLLEGLDPRQFSPDHQLRLRLLRARTALALRNAERVLEVLSAPLPATTAAATQIEYHQLRAQAYSQLGNHLEAAREYSLRLRFLSEPEDIAENQRLLWNALTQLSAITLRSLRFAPPPNEFSGWMALAEISKQYQLGRRELQVLVDGWRKSYPQHPAQEHFIDEMLQRSAKLVLQPKQIALLLPLSGRFAAAGAAVRDGVMAAYYNATPQQRIDIRVYDVAEPAWVPMNYAQALRDGAELIIGPLSKEGVVALLSRDSFPVPTLVLNSIDANELPENLYQFSLAPEEEAKQLAEHAWLLGHSYAAVFVPEGEWGERIEQAFNQRWETLGGTVTTLARYDSSKNDFSRPLRTLLNLDLSDVRHRRLEGLLGMKLHFEPRRREDIDFVFLAAFPRQARLIRPQLKFHHASDLPVLATSHVYSGAVAQDLDRDMDGIEFGDMPWTLKTDTSNKALRNDAASLRLTDNSLQRLLALGIDAYNLIGALKVLEAYPFERFQGETGALSLDPSRRINRQLSWAQFNIGVPRLSAASKPAPN